MQFAVLDRLTAVDFWSLEPAMVVVVLFAAAVVLKKLVFPANQSSSDEISRPVAVCKTYAPNEYDVIIVGLSIAGCAAAKRFSDQGRKVLVVERELTKPDRIVGELLQPGGIECLRLFGMEDCARSVGQLCTGYVAFAEGQQIILPYAQGHTGCSFHFGDFVTNLRNVILTQCRENVTVVGGTASELIYDETGKSVIGLRYKPNGSTAPTTATLSEPEPSPVKGRARDTTPRRGKTTAAGRSGSPSVHRPKEIAVNRNSAAHREPTELNVKTSDSGSPATTSVAPAMVSAKAALVVLCDGSGSNFRRKVNVNGEQDYTPHSHFVGLIVKGAKLPHETKGHVFLGKDGPILAYRLDPNEVRFLIDYKGPTLPGNKLPAKEVIQKWLNGEIVPQLPDGLRSAFQAACAHEDQIRSMPTPFFTQLFPKHKGMVALGDHQNQRHPLTGGGMTCAFRDVIELTKRLNHIPDFAANLKEVQRAVDEYTVERCRSVGCINILSWALYAVFEGPKAMRRACFHYFFLGGDAVAGPMSMLSGLRSSVPFLLYHYYRVMFYGTYLVMTHDTNVCLSDSQPLYMRFYWFLTFFVSPWRIFTTIHLLAYSTRVFIPLLFREFTPMAKFFRGTK